jgi:hypothetical protein
LQAADLAEDLFESRAEDDFDDSEDELEAMDDENVPHDLRRLFFEIQPKDDGNGDGDDTKELPADALGQPCDYVFTVKHPKRFEFVVGMLAGARSFRSISGAMKIMQACDAISFPFPTATRSAVSDMVCHWQYLHGKPLSVRRTVIPWSATAEMTALASNTSTSRCASWRTAIIAILHVCVLPGTKSATGGSMFKMLD